jgi:malate permease and related proteins
MTPILEALGRVLPVILLFILGVVMRQRAWLAAGTIADLRRLVLMVTLPAALFLTFLHVDLEPRHLPIVAIVFGASVAMLIVGPVLLRPFGVRSPYGGPLLTGFEAGMLGYAIFGGVFGQDALYRFGIVDLGHVLFVFFVLVTVLTRRSTGVRPGMAATARQFIKTPVILAILGGVAGRLIGLDKVLGGSPVLASIPTTLGLLGACTTPLIAIVIGYSTTLRRGALRLPAVTVAVRLVTWVILAIAFDRLVVEGVLGLDRLFGAAVLTMAVLPPPFVMPLYMARSSDAERGYVTDALSMATIVTLVVFPAVAAAFSG